MTSHVFVVPPTDHITVFYDISDGIPYITCITLPILQKTLHVQNDPLMYYIMCITWPLWCITLYVLHNPSAIIHYIYHVTSLLYYTTCVTWLLLCTTFMCYIYVLRDPSDWLYYIWFITPYNIQNYMCCVNPLILHNMYYMTPLVYKFHVFSDLSDVLHYMHYVAALKYYITCVTLPLWCTTFHVLCEPTELLLYMCNITPLMYYIMFFHVAPLSN